MSAVNETLEVIRSRRSVRRFGPKPIPEADLAAIAEVGLLAPSARNQQRWHFTVIRAKDKLASLSATLREQMLVSGIDFLVDRAKTPGFDPFYGATAMVMISGDDKAPWIQIDCGAAAENTALAAEALGVSSCVMVMPGLLFAGDEGDRPAIPTRNHDVINYVG